MSIRTLFISAVFSSIFVSAFSQPFKTLDRPSGYFRNPMGIPIQLSANFGEIRSNHFHMGLDIRSQQRENLPIYAAAAGYVSRIKIEQYGFGRAIYITHPNGFTTLYAHLNDFYPELNEHVKSIQYRDESWEQDISIPPGLFTVSKGQFIANSGNTGGSAGPHLHFEIRETYTENVLHPIPFDFKIADNIKPSLNRLYLYDRRYSTYEKSPTPIAIKGAGGSYSTVNNVVVVNTPSFSFGINADDRTNSSFRSGIYQAEVYVDGTIRNAFRIDELGYDYTRYINASLDYSTKAKGGSSILHLSRLPGNLIPTFSTTAGDGIITLNDSEIHEVDVKIKDASGNTSTLRFKVKLDPSLVKENFSVTNTIPMYPGQPNQLRLDNIEADFGQFTFYDKVAFLHQSQPSASSLIVSDVHQLHNYTVPVHDSFTVRIKATKPLTPALKEKVVMQMISKQKKEALKGTWQGDWMEVKFRDLGTFQLRIDNVAPTVAPSGWVNGANLKGRSSITLLAKDDISELTYFRAELDGKWLMFSRKSDYFIHKFDQHTSPGKHTLKVSIADEAGNITERTFTFTR